LCRSAQVKHLTELIAARDHFDLYIIPVDSIETQRGRVVDAVVPVKDIKNPSLKIAFYVVPVT
jgi:hypothetical protein